MANRHDFINGHCRICGKDENTYDKDGAKCGPTPFTDIFGPDDVRPGGPCRYWLCEKCGHKIEMRPGPLPKDLQLAIWCPHCEHHGIYRLEDLRGVSRQSTK
jgi:hypothetical protein